MRNHEVGVTLDKLYALSGYPAKVSYGVAKARPALLAIHKEVAAKQAEAYSEGSKTFQEGLVKIERKHATKDGDGKAIMLPNGEFAIPRESLEARDREVKEYRETHAEAAIMFDSETKVVVDFMNADAKIEKYSLPLSLIETKELVYEEDGKKQFTKAAPPTSEILLLSEVIEFDPEK